MSDNPTPPSSFKQSFKPAELLSEYEYTRLEKYFPRQADEADAAYAARAEQAGFALRLESEQARDLAHFKSVIARAARLGLPIVMVTQPIPDPVANVLDAATDEAAKARALAEARGTTK